MDIKELLNFADAEEQRLTSHYAVDDARIKTLCRIVKLVEEVGELCEEVLAHNAYQRQDKLAERNSSNLPEEIADVLITALILAKTLDVDVEDALQRKIEKIKARKY